MRITMPLPQGDGGDSGFSSRPFIGIDDAPDDRVADDVGAGEIADVDALDALKTRDGVSETRTFENYSAKKLWVFNEERLTVSTQQTQQGNGAVFSSHSKVDFAI